MRVCANKFEIKLVKTGVISVLKNGSKSRKIEEMTKNYCIGVTKITNNITTNFALFDLPWN